MQAKEAADKEAAGEGAGEEGVDAEKEAAALGKEVEVQEELPADAAPAGAACHARPHHTRVQSANCLLSLAAMVPG